MNALEVERLSVSFGKTKVLDDLSFGVERGTTLAIIGPNGAGKSVLFRALIGAIPYRGAVRWASGTRIGYVPQKLDIERDLPITGNDFLRAKTSVSHARADDSAVAASVAGLSEETLAMTIGAMSGGQFQRLMLAFALIGEPSVLLLDEPAAGIDAPGHEKMNEAIRRLQAERGVTVLLISHDLSVVYEYATNVLCLGGERPWCGPPQTALTTETLSELYGAPLKFHVHDRIGN
ncbi:MAG: metal ABC transporter ATP-binding protein [Candidatus Binataceae bacterium]